MEKTMTNVISIKERIQASVKQLTWEKVMIYCGLYFAIAVILGVFASLNSNFLTVNNFINILDQASYYLVCAVGITFVLVSGANDMSVGSQVAFYSVIGAMHLMKTGSMVQTLLLLLVLCIVVGLANGLFVVVIGLPPFIGTIAVGYVVRGIVAYMTEQTTISGLPASFTMIAWERTLGLPNLTWIAFFVIVLGWYVLKCTAYGRMVYACGGNRTAARVMGVRVTWIKISAYLISASLAMIAALMLASRSSVARAGSAELLHMECIAAAVIGGTSLKGGQGSIIGTFVGVLLISMIRSGLNGMGVNTFWQLVFTGTITLFAAILDSFKSRNNG